MNQRKKKPNVIFILADDLGWAELGCYGHTFNETPHLDALAARGVRFQTAYASSTVCSPSRAGLLTGQWPPRNGITDYLRPETEWYLPVTGADNELPADTEYRIDPSMVTMAQLFKNSGYATGMVGKWHLSGYDENGVLHGPDQYGFDDVRISEQVFIGGGSYFWPYTCVDPKIQPVLGNGEYLVDRMHHEAVDFIKGHADEPFFLFLSHYAVHTILAGKPEDVEYFKNKPGAGQAPEGKEVCWAKENNPELAAMLRSIDDGVGRIVDTLRELGIEDDTLIVFTSDNGGEARVTRNAHLRGGKSMTYEGGLRVSLVMAGPGVGPVGRVVKEPTINLDFYPTFAEMLNHPVPEGHVVDGQSMWPVLRGETPTASFKDRPFLWHYPLDKPHFLGGRSSAAVRRREWKLIEFFDDGSAELYNLADDESEQHNLSADRPEQLRERHAELTFWLKEVDGTIPENQQQPDISSQ